MGRTHYRPHFELGACDCGCRFGLLGRGRLSRFGDADLACDWPCFWSAARTCTLPFRMAPSSTLIRWATTSPVNAPSPRISRRSLTLDVALDFAQNHNFAGGDVGRDAAVTSDGDPTIAEIDRTFDLAVDIERFGAARLHP